jgi:hypothetical protein
MRPAGTVVTHMHRLRERGVRYGQRSDQSQTGDG